MDVDEGGSGDGGNGSEGDGGSDPSPRAPGMLSGVMEAAREHDDKSGDDDAGDDGGKRGAPAPIEKPAAPVSKPVAPAAKPGKTAKAAVPPAVVPPVVAPAPQTISPESHYRAAALGKDFTWTQKFKSPEALNEVLTALEEHKKANPSGSQQPAEGAKKPVAQTPTFKAEDIPDLDPKDYDAPVVDGWSKMKQLLAYKDSQLSEFAGQIKEIRDEMSGTSKSHQLQAAESFYNWFDDSIGKLDGAKELFGEGYGDELDETADTFKNRDKLYGAFFRLQEGYKSRGEKVPRKETLLKQAFTTAFGEHIEKNATTKIADKIKANKGRMSLAPTDRNGSPKDGASVARANVSKVMDRIRNR